MAKAEEQAAISNVIQILEASPDSSTPSAVALVSSNDTLVHRERLEGRLGGWQFWSRLANHKKLSAFSLHRIM